MIETLEARALTGQYEGRLWWVGYVCPHRYATTGIELEVSPGCWIVLPNFDLTSWPDEAAMVAAIELRVRAHLQDR
jgi:hypothetical protein